MSVKKSILGIQNIFILAGAILFFISPFLSSGDWGWTLGWVFTITMIAGTLLSRYQGNLANPGLERELTSVAMKETKVWDKWIAPVMSIWLPILAVSVAGLDKRLGWSGNLSTGIDCSGLFLMIAGFAFGSWAMIVNPFFSFYVRIQKDLGQYVVTKGPYSFLRHPGYFSSLLTMSGFPLLLDSLWAFLPILLIVISIILRTLLEDRVLTSELPGYKDYAAKVRYRLFPGIW